MIARNRCTNCRRFFQPRPGVEDQQYCGRKACQRERKLRWQREKLAGDPDYKANHKRAHRDWAERNRDYWRRYRAAHAQYRDRNRTMQKERDAKRRERNLAKKDATQGKTHIETGIYYLVPAVSENLAKKDATGQKVRIISEGCKDSGAILQRRTRLPPSMGSP